MAERTGEDKKSSVRDHLEYLAERGDSSAQAELDAEPQCPEEVKYLVEWAYLLFGRSGAGLSGPNPLSFNTVEAWARLYDLEVSPLEVEALVWLDDAMRNAKGGDEAEQPDPAPAAPQRRSWPTRKAEPVLQTEE